MSSTNPGGHGCAAERDVDTDNDGHDRQTDSCAAGPGSAGVVLPDRAHACRRGGMVVELGSVAARPGRVNVACLVGIVLTSWSR
jgi:hypothetical protein